MEALRRNLLISSDNPHSRRHFKSNKSIRDEQERQLSIKALVIHPYSKFKGWYDIYLIFFYMSVLITKPFDAAFLRRHNYEELLFYREYTISVDILSWIDIIMQMFTGYVVETRTTVDIVLSHSRIARKRLLSPSFYCDILSSFPKCILYYPLFDPTYVEAYGVLSLLSLFKIVRLLALISCINKSAQYLRLQARGAVFLVCSLIISLIIIHWMACMQFVVPRFKRLYFSETTNYDSWMYTIDILDRPIYTQYVHCMLRSAAFILGIDVSIYKMILPEDVTLAIVTYTIGKILVAFVWISLAVAILRSRSMDIKLLEVINQLDEYLKRKQLPLNLMERITKYYDLKYQQRFFRESNIECMLSSNLKHETHIHVCRWLISSVPLFADLNPQETTYVVEHLKSEIYLANDTIISSDSYGDAMYFLSSGTVAVYTRSGKEICHLQDGAYFGEISLILKNQRRVATVRTIEKTKVYRLEKKDFDYCIIKNKRVHKKLIRNAAKRLKETNAIEEGFKRDLFEQTYQRVSVALSRDRSTSIS